MILEQDRAPSSPLKTWGLMIGGVVALVGVALFFKRSSTPPAATYNSD